MKILHYIPSIDRTSGGVGAYMQLLTTELGKLVELHVVTHREANPLTLENCTVHYIPKNNNPFSNKGKTEFLTLLNDIKPDVFHANSCWLPLSARTTIWAKNIGYTVVYTPHGMLEPWIMKRHYWTKKFPASLLFQKRGIHPRHQKHAEELTGLIGDAAWDKYEAMADAFIKKEIDMVDVVGFISTKGNLIKFQHSTGLFAIFSDKGTISTLFIPDKETHGKSPEEYWEQQSRDFRRKPK